MRTRTAQAGFTLIELLVSIAILSVLAVGASLTLSQGAAPEARDLTSFRDRYEEQRTLAISEGRIRGLYVSPVSLQTALREDTLWNKRGAVLRWRRQVSVFAEPVPGEQGAPPQIVFLPTGQTNGFRIGFGTAGQCQSDGWERMTCDGS